MVAVPIALPGDPATIQSELLARFRIEIPVLDVDGRSFLRLSVQAYTTDEECRALVDAIMMITATKNAKSR
jgi:hypothetical protein